MTVAARGMPCFSTDTDDLSIYPMMIFKTTRVPCEDKPCWHHLDPGVLTTDLLTGNGPHDDRCQPEIIAGVRHDPCQHQRRSL